MLDKKDVIMHDVLHRTNTALAPSAKVRSPGRLLVGHQIVVGSAIGTAPILAAGILYLAIFNHVLPLSEYRGWLTFNHPSWLDVLTAPFAWSNDFNRTLPLYSVRVIDRICSYGIVCNNISLLLIMPLSGFFWVLALGVLGRWKHPSALFVSTLFVVFSEPWLHTAAWQATVLDRSAALLSSLAIFLYVITLRTTFLWRTLVGNTVILAIIIMAYNCKEAAWTLVPSLALLGYLVEANSGRLRSFLRSAAMLGLPLVYSAYVFLRLAAHRIAHPLEVHNFGGSPIKNLWTFLHYLFNTNESFDTAVWLLTFIAAFSVFVAVGKRMPQLFIVGTWSAISFLLSLVLAIFTQYASAFYMLVPSLYLVGTLYAVGCILLDLTTQNARMRLAVLAAGIVICAQHLWFFDKRLHIYQRIAAQSVNFVGSFPSIAAAVDDRSTDVLLLYPKDNYFGHLFLDGGKLGYYIFGINEEKASLFDRHFKWATLENEHDTIVGDRPIRVIFDEEMRLRSLEVPR